MANRQKRKNRTHLHGNLNSTQKLSQPSVLRSQGVALGFRVTGLRPVDKQLLSNAPSRGAIPRAPTPPPLAFVPQAFGLLANRQNAKTERSHAANSTPLKNYPNLPPYGPQGVALGFRVTGLRPVDKQTPFQRTRRGGHSSRTHAVAPRFRALSLRPVGKSPKT